MNILTNELPNEINGIKIKTSFIRVLKFEEIWESPEIKEDEKIFLTLSLFFDDYTMNNVPTEELVKTFITFYSCNGFNGKDIEIFNNDEKPDEFGSVKMKKPKKQRSVKKYYSFNQDAEYIYSSFLQQYNIDLIDEKDMHWFKFKALFDSLTEETKMGQILKYRAIDTSKIKDKEQKKFYEKQKKRYKLKEYKTEEELEQEFIDMF